MMEQNAHPAVPPCPHFGKCGGCTFQDVSYETQLARKKEALEEIPGLRVSEVFFGKPYEYRTRMDLVFHPEGIGFRQKRNWRKIIDISECLISRPELNTLISEIRNFFKKPDSFDVVRRKGTFRYAVIRTPPEDSAISFVLNRNSEGLEKGKNQVREFAEITSARNVLCTYVSYNSGASISNDYDIIKGSDFLTEKYAGNIFRYNVQGFAQNNHDVMEILHSCCSRILKKYGDSSTFLLDLYGGVGIFGINNAAFYEYVLILENMEKAVLTAGHNIKANRAANVAAVCMDAKHLKRIKLPESLCVIIDPPRSGVHPKTLKHLKSIKPHLILYVSCSVKQLAHDLSFLEEYKTVSVTLFDLFPQTPHLESVIELVPR